MKYQKETISRYVKKARAAVRAARVRIAKQIKSGKVLARVATGNKKVGKSLNINTLAVLTCGGMCSKCGCKYYCYAIKDALRFKTCMNARAVNTALALYNRERFFADVAKVISRRRSFRYIRWHVSGEIIDLDYFAGMVEIARAFPDRVFWTYTKQYGIVNSYVAEHGNDRRAAIPDNFTVMFSDWDGFPMDNRYGFPVFRFYPSGKQIPAGQFVCPGNCDICKAGACGCVAGQSASVMEH